MSILECTNPNFLRVDLVNKGNKNRKKHRKSVELISRERFLENTSNAFVKYYKVRCNKCLGCRLFKGYEWSNRLLAESYTVDHSYFITLTFIDEALELFNINDKEHSIMRPVQLFIKRLRKKFKDLKFKYFAVCELGGETLRLHYHMILFSDVDIFNDKYFYDNSNGYDLFLSPTLQSLWKYGNAPFNIASHETMKYTANYVQGKGQVLGHSYSRGIGNSYIERNMFDNVYYINGKLSKVPSNLKVSDSVDKFIKIKEIEILKDFENPDSVSYYQSLDSKARVLNKQKQFKKT